MYWRRPDAAPLLVANEPIIGTIRLRRFFGTTREMYDALAFVHETTTDS
jgi:hypothetical protein